MKKTLLVVFASAVLAGCSTWHGVTDYAFAGAGTLLDRYCSEPDPRAREVAFERLQAATETEINQEGLCP